MSMIKRANGQVESFTDEQGKEVKADNLVWADEKDKQPEIKDALDIPVLNDLNLDINSSDDDDSVIAKDC
jgi:hypothetical protein